MNVHFSNSELQTIVHLFESMIAKLDKIMLNLTDLTANVTRNTSAVASAVALLDNIKAQLDAAGTDPIALKALSDTLGTNDDALAAAVVKNTPAENV